MKGLLGPIHTVQYEEKCSMYGKMLHYCLCKKKGHMDFDVFLVVTT